MLLREALADSRSLEATFNIANIKRGVFREQWNMVISLLIANNPANLFQWIMSRECLGDE